MGLTQYPLFYFVDWLWCVFRWDGSSHTTLTSKQIKSNQIKSNQIKSKQIKSNQIKSNQIKLNHKQEDDQRKDHFSLTRECIVLSLSWSVYSIIIQ
jgi:hypothetical protein